MLEGPPKGKKKNQKGATGGKVTPLAEDNKGYQLLQKMGWSGSGLGANEQGMKKFIEPTVY